MRLQGHALQPHYILENIMIARNLLLVSLLFCAGHAMAQEPADSVSIITVIEQGGLIEISAPAGFEQRLARETPEETQAPAENASASQSATRVGYRVQVFDDNNVHTAKHQAQARKQQMQSRFPEFNAYIQFNSPYWRVKVGDFKTRSEAETAMNAIRTAFPALGSQLRVVRDRINQQ